MPQSRLVVAAIAAGAVLVAFLAWAASQETLGFMPHGHCYLWQPPLVALHVLSDGAIGLAYIAISATLGFLVYRARSTLPFHWMIVAFGVFIVACGATHLMEVWTLWWPSYWVSGNVKLVTALVSVTTAIALPPLVPRALALLSAEHVAESRRVELQDRERHLAAEQRARGEADALRQAAEAANRSKDQFLAMISHELRNPLSPMLAWARMLRSGELDEDKRAKAYEVIERSASAQVQLVEDLLDVSRIVSGKLRLDVRPTAFGPVVEAALESLRPSADAKQIRLHVVLDPRAGLISGDPDRLQQVVWNLVSNAIKFTPKGGRVSITLRRVNSHVELSVVDSGKGIAEEDLPHLFERFWQSEAGSGRRYGGLGLGLAIVRHLVELHGGTVSAHSAGLDAGTEFRVEIPVAALGKNHSSEDRIHPAATTDAPSIPFARLDGAKLLVVDDDPDANDTMQALFSTCGAEVRVAASAAQALAILDRWLPDVIVSDIGMPGEDGYSLIAKVRERPRDRGGVVPAIALTAFARVEDRIRILAAGFMMHVTKPVDPRELTAVVRMAWKSGQR